MDDSEFRLHIHGEHGQIDARALERAISALLQLLGDLDNNRWVITDLSVGSAKLAVRPARLDGDVLHERFAEIAAGLEDLAASTTPISWLPSQLDALIALGGVVRFEGADSIDLEFGAGQPVPITTGMVDEAKRARRSQDVSLGSVRGHVDRYLNRRSRREFGLVDVVTGEVVTVRFAAKFEQLVHHAVDTDVIAWGVVHRDHSGRRRSMELEGLEVMEPGNGPSERVLLNDLVGLFGQDWTDGMNSTDWVRRQRD